MRSVRIRDAVGQLRALRQNLEEGAAREALRRTIHQHLERSTLSVRLVDLEHAKGPTEGKFAPTQEEASVAGPRLLELYFDQLLHTPAAFLDLRLESFAVAPDAPRSLLWDPSGLFVEWDPAFLDALRQMYRGFYEGPEDRFRTALRSMKLDAAEPVFRKHFGDGQREATFRVDDLVATLRDAAHLCTEPLHPNFLCFGIYLATLYAHLEDLGGGPFDAQGAFERVSRARSAERADAAF